MKLGIMQGRLVPPEAGRFQSFPRARWRDEFSLASAAGLDTIEWIFDAHGEDVNPIGTAHGVREMRGLSERYGVAIESVCADWFMDFPLTDPDPASSCIRWGRLDFLMQQAACLQVKRIVVPFVDASAIRTPEQARAVADGIGALCELIDRTQVEIHLETSLSPQEFADFLARTPHPGVKVNYDSGNSASLGYRPTDEFQAYGARVGSVHLKDRRLGAGTVPMGDGNADFDGLFESLAKVRYSGDFILQVARGTDGDELEWARNNVRTARRLIQSLTGNRS